MDYLIHGLVIWMFGAAATFAYLAFTIDKLNMPRAIAGSMFWPLFWAGWLISRAAWIGARLFLSREDFERIKRDLDP